jgi:hypothetical protein
MLADGEVLVAGGYNNDGYRQRGTLRLGKRVRHFAVQRRQKG